MESNNQTILPNLTEDDFELMLKSSNPFKAYSSDIFQFNIGSEYWLRGGILHLPNGQHAQFDKTCSHSQTENDLI